MPLLESVRRRVRLRTRLRRARDAWRSAFPRRLPAWDPDADPAHPPSPPPLPASGPVTADAATANPRGRHRYGHRLPHTRLRLAAGGAGEVRWEAVRIPDGTVVVAGRAGDPLDARQAAVLSEVGLLVAGGDPGPAAVHVLVQLAMTGVVVHAPDLPAAAAGRLAPELADLVRAPLPDRRADPLEWEIRSVRQRRAAMRHHATGLALPLVSAVLVSKRPQRVAPALAALAAQTYPELEIVLGTHGFEVPPPGTGVRVVPIGAGRNLGEALAEATAAATGTIVTKVDDDDWYGPEHIWDLVLARHYSGATVVGKGAELVYLAPEDLTVRRRMAAETGTDTVAGGTIALARDDLAALGGWPAVPRWVDRALLDRVLGEGGTIYRTHPLGFIYTRHGDGHTWEADLAQFRVDARRTWPGLPPYPEFGDPARSWSG